MATLFVRISVGRKLISKTDLQRKGRRDYLIKINYAPASFNVLRSRCSPNVGIDSAESLTSSSLTDSAHTRAYRMNGNDRWSTEIGQGFAEWIVHRRCRERSIKRHLSGRLSFSSDRGESNRGVALYITDIHPPLPPPPTVETISGRRCPSFPESEGRERPRLVAPGPPAERKGE